MSRRETYAAASRKVFAKRATPSTLGLAWLYSIGGDTQDIARYVETTRETCGKQSGKSLLDGSFGR